MIGSSQSLGYVQGVTGPRTNNSVQTIAPIQVDRDALRRHSHRSLAEVCLTSVGALPPSVAHLGSCQCVSACFCLPSLRPSFLSVGYCIHN